MKLLDTTVAIDYLRGRRDAAGLLEGLVGQGERLAASELVRFEILAGALGAELQEIERFFSAIDWLPVEETVARRAADLAQRYRRSHGGIGAVDYLIAAAALVLDVELLTTNVRHFPMLDGLVAPY